MKHIYTHIALGALFMALSGCAAIKPTEERTTRVEDVIKERKVVIDTACSWVRPVYIHSMDTLTPGTARQILVHNETWETKCQKQQEPEQNKK